MHQRVRAGGVGGPLGGTERGRGRGRQFYEPRVLAEGEEVALGWTQSTEARNKAERHTDAQEMQSQPCESDGNQSTYAAPTSSVKGG